MTRDRQGIDSYHSVFSSPDKRAQEVAVEITFICGAQANDLAMFIDGHRCDPKPGSQIAEIGDGTPIPKQGMHSSAPAHRLIADARDADDLTAVINRRGGPAGVVAEQGQRLNLTRRRSPNDRPKLQFLCS